MVAAHSRQDAHASAILAAEQFGDGLTEQFSSEIPESGFDAAYGGYGDSAGCARAAGENGHFGKQGIDIERVGAEDRVFEITKHDVLDAESPVGFSVAADAGIGIDAHVGIAAWTADDHGLEIGNLDLLLERLRGGGEVWQCSRGGNDGGKTF